MPIPPLGKFERVDLRNVWVSESGDFTPWLAQPDNLAILADVIGLDLELEAQEQRVGPFRADILCKDTVSGSYVLIENQLAATDHTHLGQLMTYAAGLDAVTIVWIARTFTPEHRAAIDWLNRITEETFNFFALEIEVWRIGNSAPAPKFNIVSQPNEWQKTIAESAKHAGTTGVSGTMQLQQEYWSALRDLLLQRKSIVKPRSPQPQNWTEFAIGRSTLFLSANCNTNEDRIWVGLNIYGSYGKSFFKQLSEQKDDIEARFGTELNWNSNPGRQVSYITLNRQDSSLTNRATWPQQHVWLADTLEKFDRVFRERVKQLVEVDVNPAE